MIVNAYSDTHTHTHTRARARAHSGGGDNIKIQMQNVVLLYTGLPDLLQSSGSG